MESARSHFVNVSQQETHLEKDERWQRWLADKDGCKTIGGDPYHVSHSCPLKDGHKHGDRRSSATSRMLPDGTIVSYCHAHLDHNFVAMANEIGFPVRDGFPRGSRPSGLPRRGQDRH